jgi:hypothetical protein
MFPRRVFSQCHCRLLIWIFPGEQYPMVQLADPCATFLFSFLVIYSTLMVSDCLPPFAD